MLYLPISTQLRINTKFIRFILYYKLILHLSYFYFMSAVGSHKSPDIWWLNQLVITRFIIREPLILFSRITPHNPFVLFFAFKRVSQFWNEGSRSQLAFLAKLINIFYNLISLDTFLSSTKKSCFMWAYLLYIQIRREKWYKIPLEKTYLIVAYKLSSPSPEDLSLLLRPISSNWFPLIAAAGFEFSSSISGSG